MRDCDFNIKKLKKLFYYNLKKRNIRNLDFMVMEMQVKKIVDILSKADLSIKKQLNYLKNR